MLNDTHSFLVCNNGQAYCYNGQNLFWNQKKARGK